MGALRIARLMSLRALAALLSAAGALVVWILRALKRAPSPSEVRTGVRDHAIVLPFLGHTAKIVLGTLAYNAFVRSNRMTLAKLDGFAHDLFAVLTTGSHVNDAAAVVPLKPAPAAGVA